MKRFLILALAVACVAGAAVNVPASKDAHVVQNSYGGCSGSNCADTNFGSAQQIVIGTYHITSEALFAYPLNIPRSCTIKKALLNFPAASSYTGSGDSSLVVKQLDPSTQWSENAVTFNNKPATVGDNLSVIVVAHGDGSSVTPIPLDVTAAVSTAHAAGNVEFGVDASTVNSNTIFLPSKEAGNTSSLTIAYDCDANATSTQSIIYNTKDMIYISSPGGTTCNHRANYSMVGVSQGPLYLSFPIANVPATVSSAKFFLKGTRCVNANRLKFYLFTMENASANFEEVNGLNNQCPIIYTNIPTEFSVSDSSCSNEGMNITAALNAAKAAGNNHLVLSLMDSIYTDLDNPNFCNVFQNPNLNPRYDDNYNCGLLANSREYNPSSFYITFEEQITTIHNTKDVLSGSSPGGTVCSHQSTYSLIGFPTGPLLMSFPIGNITSVTSALFYLQGARCVNANRLDFYLSTMQNASEILTEVSGIDNDCPVIGINSTTRFEINDTQCKSEGIDVTAALIAARAAGNKQLVLALYYTIDPYMGNSNWCNRWVNTNATAFNNDSNCGVLVNSREYDPSSSYIVVQGSFEKVVCPSITCPCGFVLGDDGCAKCITCRSRSHSRDDENDFDGREGCRDHHRDHGGHRHTVPNSESTSNVLCSVCSFFVILIIAVILQ
jgi:hypothetical protein